jgi:hypothetical protein
MTTTADMTPPLATTGWGVECRTPGRKWTLVAVARDRDYAEKLLFDLMAKARGSGDWRVKRP